MNTTPCRSCGAPMMWARTLQNKRIPLDPEPCEDGNIFLEDGVAIYAKKNEMFEGPRYKSHFVTCPDAKKFRKKE